MVTETTERRSAVARQKLQVTVDALILAAQRGMQEHGLDVTVDQIADLAEVGRRTVFRHFASREDLLQAAIAARFADFFGSMPCYSGSDWQGWLSELARLIHHTTANSGRLIWELRTRRLPPRLAAAYGEHRQALQLMFATTAATLWEAAGGKGTPPDQLRQTVATHLSPLFTQTVLLDADGTPELAAELATTAITATTRQLLGQ